MLNIMVLVKLVPDVVEELEIASDGRSLDPASVRLILNERDEHALEEALLLKERHGGTVTVVALDVPEVDDVLFTALAKGADRAVKISGVEAGLSTWAIAGALAKALTSSGLVPVDLILTGVQAIDDLDGQTGPIVARLLELPYVGMVCRVEVDVEAHKAVVIREYAGGVTGTFEVSLPAVLGIQSAEKPPRYVPVAKVRAAMKTQQLESVPVPGQGESSSVEILQMAKLEVTGGAVMLEGSPEEIAERIWDLLKERGLV
ncbi:MAG: electron transfer flavoprotein subunit beta/FixA family protein [Armatimonadota bacterium]|nr:electron transfer flavoprotein subunit beta/FixA family protein [Armatimonadota bacterium]